MFPEPYEWEYFIDLSINTGLFNASVVVSVTKKSLLDQGWRLFLSVDIKKSIYRLFLGIILVSKLVTVDSPPIIMILLALSNYLGF